MTGEKHTSANERLSEMTEQEHAKCADRAVRNDRTGTRKVWRQSEMTGQEHAKCERRDDVVNLRCLNNYPLSQTGTVECCSRVADSCNKSPLIFPIISVPPDTPTSPSA